MFSRIFTAALPTEGGDQNRLSIGGALTMENEHLKLAIQYN